MENQKVIKLPPGFRFHPTDEELVVQYLRRKALSYPLPAWIIPDVHLNQYNPWDLPLNSAAVGCGEKKERYLFNYYRGGDARSNKKVLRRVAGSGYWKSTGKEKMIVVEPEKQVIGMKRVMVFYGGIKPSVISRTDWVLHEYSLIVSPKKNSNGDLNAAGFANNNMLSPTTTSSQVTYTEGWVLCRVFQKKSKVTDMMKKDSNLMESRSSVCNFSNTETEIMESSCVTQDSNKEEEVEDEQSSITISA